jgi:hypothetical protein
VCPSPNSEARESKPQLSFAQPRILMALNPAPGSEPQVGLMGELGGSRRLKPQTSDLQSALTAKAAPTPPSSWPLLPLHILCKLQNNDGLTVGRVNWASAWHFRSQKTRPCTQNKPNTLNPNPAPSTQTLRLLNNRVN